MRKMLPMIALVAFVPWLVAPQGGFGERIGNYDFRVEIDGVDTGAFATVTGLSVEQEVIEYREGSENLVRKLPGRLKYGDITLKRGYAGPSPLQQAFETIRMTGDPGPPHDVAVVILDRAQNEVAHLGYSSCFLSRYELASSDDEHPHLEEEVTLTCDFYALTP